ncbi:hypothetical protein Taro_020162 [Colocasia esculenta]|uniref:DYW domain-containing protein n=1 Tax=Colocasia esculenta TaxID=4460 RepID=A0A843UMY8_COLES|nr:hypothetical protein [Colocasia esculenta]
MFLRRRPLQRPLHALAAAVAPAAAEATTWIPEFPSPLPGQRYDPRLLLRSCSDAARLRQAHARLLVLGALSDAAAAAQLLASYASLHMLDSARLVLDSAADPCSLAWNAMIRAYTRAGHHGKALGCFWEMLARHVDPDKYTFPLVLRACAGAGDLVAGESAHQEAAQRELDVDVYVRTALVDMYAKMGMLTTAKELFETMRETDVVSWNAMISGFASGGDPWGSLTLFRRMQSAGLEPNSVTILNLLPAICELSDILLCRALHGFAVRRLLLSKVSNGLMDSYSKCGSVETARLLFDGKSGSRDAVSWGTMISGYVQNGCFSEALELFDDLSREKIGLNRVSVVSALVAATETRDLEKGRDIHAYAGEEWINSDVSVVTALPNRVTIVSVLPACSELQDVKLGKSIHAYVLKSQSCLDVSTVTALVATYAKCGFFHSAHALFDAVSHKDIITWNALINGYAQTGDAGSAMKMFHQLRLMGMHPDSGTMVGVLPACALLNDINNGMCAHGLIIKNGFEADLHVKNVIVDMYAKCGDFASAENLFLVAKSCNDEISWNTLITGYMQSGRAKEAMSAFHQMKCENLKPNLVTYVSILPAAAYFAALREGMSLHGSVIKSGFESHLIVGNSLIDMYSKCGRVDYAKDIFDQMQIKDIVSWNAMMSGYAAHGLGEDAVALFSRMCENHVKADSISFLAVLSACRHGGLIEEGRRIFNSMSSEHNFEPNLEHYACLVDLLGRCSQLDEAWHLIQSMPMAPDAGVWGALLGACRMHSNAWLGEIALKNLVKLEPQNAAHYVVLSSIYAQLGRWAEARSTRKMMGHTGLTKTPGCSWVEIKNIVHAFRVGDQSHPQYESMSKLWDTLQEKMEDMGYVPDTSSVLHNVEEEEKTSFLYSHSERLAISFALLNTEPETLCHRRSNELALKSVYTSNLQNGLEMNQGVMLK